MASGRAPVFSVIVPAYNAEATIRQTLDSVLSQNFADFEVVIVDDGSTDSTASVAQEFAQHDSRVVLVSRENGGTGAAYNTGIEAARGEWIVMLSADDMLAFNHLASMVDAIREHPQAALFTSNGWYLYDNGKRELAYEGEPPFGRLGCSLAQLFDRCFFPVGATFLRQACLSVGGFESNLYAEDYYLFLRLLASGYSHRYIDAPLAVHTRNRRQKSAAGLSMRKGDIATIECILSDFELAQSDVEAARLALERLRRNVARREKIYKVLGPVVGEYAIQSIRRFRLY